MFKKIIAIMILVFSLNQVAYANIWQKGDQKVLNNAKKDFQSAFTDYQKLRQDYLSALNKYQSFECRSNKSNCDQLKENLRNKVKLYLKQSIKMMNRFVVHFQKRTENIVCNDSTQEILTEINKWQQYLSDKENSIDSLDTDERIIQTAKDLKVFWNETEVKTAKYRGQLMLCRFSSVFDRYQEIFDKLETYLNNLDEKYDNEAFIDALEKLKSKLESAKNQAQEAEEIIEALSYETLNNFKDAQKNLKSSAKEIREIHSDLKSLVSEVKKAKPKESAGFNDNLPGGNFIFKGEGVVRVEGSVSVEGLLGNDNFTGKLTIIDKGTNMAIDIFGIGEKIETESGSLEYQRLKKITLSGRKIIFEINSQFIDIEINGSGLISVKGAGLYQDNKGNLTDLPEGELKINL